MSKLDTQFKENLKLILENGFEKKDRTGVGTISYPGVMIRHDMSEGFPLLTLRKIPFKSPAVEMEGFIKGITSKQWYKDRGCNYWNNWCSPEKVKYGTDEETKRKMEECDDLGPIYGKQWRSFGHDFTDVHIFKHNNIDQLKNIIDTLKKDKSSRRLLCSAWNPMELHKMALPPCHFAWQVNVTNDKLNLFYYMRSVDFILGNDLNTYGLLLHLIAKEVGLEEGMLVGFFADAHCYTNHIENAKVLLDRDESLDLPTISTDVDNFSIFNWEHTQTKLNNYSNHGSLKFDVAV